MYLLQLVQALKYENFDDIKNGLEPTKKDSQGSVSENVSNSGINSAEIDRYGYPGECIFKLIVFSFSYCHLSFPLDVPNPTYLC
jgi:hypothetical protein